jgi:hypothetical protein
MLRTQRWIEYVTPSVSLDNEYGKYLLQVDTSIDIIGSLLEDGKLRMKHNVQQQILSDCQK